jgi:hypothetical protein
MDIPSGSRKPAGQIEPYFEHGNGCLINPIGASYDQDEEKKRARDLAEGPVEPTRAPQGSSLPGCPECGFRSGQVCCLHNVPDL